MAIQQGFSTFADLFYILVQKREGGLHLCIDYGGLKQNTVKYRYALFFLKSLALEKLKTASVFEKLNLQSAISSKLDPNQKKKY